jgi:ketosteroid isomerase-like protein
MDRDARTRARLEEHWEASERGDIDTEHAIYAEDAILDYPQSGERFRGRSKIQRSAAGTRPNATSLSCGSGAATTCG